ncbi:MAG: hypothetical protein QM528_07215 [Phycisphaerales bacterium]|nr:hypothetical protein [Phycisphaerales bacterium]
MKKTTITLGSFLTRIELKTIKGAGKGGLKSDVCESLVLTKSGSFATHHTPCAQYSSIYVDPTKGAIYTDITCSVMLFVCQ